MREFLWDPNFRETKRTPLQPLRNWQKIPTTNRLNAFLPSGSIGSLNIPHIVYSIHKCGKHLFEWCSTSTVGTRQNVLHNEQCCLRDLHYCVIEKQAMCIICLDATLNSKHTFKRSFMLLRTPKTTAICFV